MRIGHKKHRRDTKPCKRRDTTRIQKPTREEFEGTTEEGPLAKLLFFSFAREGPLLGRATTLRAALAKILVSHYPMLFLVLIPLSLYPFASKSTKKICFLYYGALLRMRNLLTKHARLRIKDTTKEEGPLAKLFSFPSHRKGH